MVKIREYQLEDQERIEHCIIELQDVERSLEPDRVEGASMVQRNLAELLTDIHQDVGQVFVAEVQRDVVGFVRVCLEHEVDAYLSTLTDYAYISDLVVLPPYQNRGIGTALLRKAEEFAWQHGMTALKIGVLARNQNAATLYLHSGFRPYELVLLKQLEEPSASGISNHSLSTPDPNNCG
jgi:GNAT superfamily N-acetyltransferase